MNLLIDIGNSRIKWLLEDNEKNKTGLSGAMYHDKSDIQELFYENWGNLPRPERIMVSNVNGARIAGKLDTWIEKEWQMKPEYIKTEAFSHGVKNAYPDYRKLGIDRWMAIIAAWDRYQGLGEAICVVDCGTATTIDGISKTGQHLGGFIIPGYTMMQEVLVNNTSDVNMSEKMIPTAGFSNTTEQCVNSGCYVATLATIDRVVTSMKNDCGGHLQCIITGGNAGIVLEKLSVEFDYDANLVLHGLAIISGQE